MMTRDDAIRLIEDAVAADHGTVHGEETLEKIAWDSMASVSFIALVDEHQGRTLDAKLVAKCKTVADLVTILLEAS